MNKYIKKYINLIPISHRLLFFPLLFAERKCQNEAAHILLDYLFRTEPKRMLTNDLQEDRDGNK